MYFEVRKVIYFGGIFLDVRRRLQLRGDRMTIEINLACSKTAVKQPCFTAFKLESYILDLIL